MNRTLPTTKLDGGSAKRKIPVGNYKAVENLKDARLMFSFQLLDLGHEYFNLGGTCQRWFVTLFRKLNEISNIPFGQLVSGSHNKIFRFHSHDPKKISVQFPFDVKQSETRQIRIGKGQGGVHGLLIDNMFYVVWLDRHHNLYPSGRYGGLITFKGEGECCGYNDHMIETLQSEVAFYKDELNTAKELLKERAKKEVAPTDE